MPRLVVERVSSANAVRQSLLPNEADEFGTLDGEILTVPDNDTAEMLVETYPNVEWVGNVPETATDETHSVAAAIEAGECPWCDEYTGDHVGQHASSAHAEEWADYKVD